MPDQKPMRARCLGGFSVMWMTKPFISPVEIRIFCPKKTKIGIFVYFAPGLAGLFGALLLVGWLVVVARGPYLATHLFTLCILMLIVVTLPLYRCNCMLYIFSKKVSPTTHAAIRYRGDSSSLEAPNARPDDCCRHHPHIILKIL